MEFQDLSNEQLVGMLQVEFNDAMFEELVRRFRPLIRHFRYVYAISYFEMDDYVQEARIVLQSALERYQGESLYFAGFFKKVLKNHFINLGKQQSAQKRVNWRLCQSLEDENGIGKEEILDMHQLLPEDQLIVKETQHGYWTQLSALEQQVFHAFLNGLTADEIAIKVGEPVEKCRNALDRCRSKLKRYLQ